MQNVQNWTLKWSPEVVFVPFFSLNLRFWFYFCGTEQIMFMCPRLNTEVNWIKSSQQCNKSILWSPLVCLCFCICQTTRLTFFVVGHPKKVTDHILFCIGDSFYCFLCILHWRRYVATRCRCPSRVQQDSFTFATGSLHTLRICLGANTLTCKYLSLSWWSSEWCGVEVPTRRQGLFQGICLKTNNSEKMFNVSDDR